MIKGTKMLISGITKKNIRSKKKIDPKTFDDIRKLLELSRECFNKNKKRKF